MSFERHNVLYFPEHKFTADEQAHLTNLRALQSYTETPYDILQLFSHDALPVNDEFPIGVLLAFGDEVYKKTSTGWRRMADADDVSDASAALAAHEADTTNIHGIVDTANLMETGDAAGGVLSGTYPNPGFAVDMATQAELNTHEADTTGVHGIANTANLMETGDAAGGVLSGTYPNPAFAEDMATQVELDAHAVDTSNVHGIADTGLLLKQLSVSDSITAAMRIETTVDPANVPANSVFNHDHTVAAGYGVAAGDVVLGYQAPSLTNGLLVQRIGVNGANTIRIRLMNVTGAAINEGAGVWHFWVVRP